MSAGTDYERLRQQLDDFKRELVAVRAERDSLLEAIEDWREIGNEADRRARDAIEWAYTHKVKPAEAALVAVREERDALAKALQDELDNWNPEARPTIAAKLEAAERERDSAREAIRTADAALALAQLPCDCDEGDECYCLTYPPAEQIKVARAALSVVDAERTQE